MDPHIRLWAGIGAVVFSTLAAWALLGLASGRKDRLGPLIGMAVFSAIAAGLCAASFVGWSMS